MACGCVDSSCSCVMANGTNTTVTGDGSASNPFRVSTPGETSWTGTNTDGGIDITPGGATGHNPVINLNLDPDSPAPLSVSGAGLSVGCCPVNTLFLATDEDVTLTEDSQNVAVDTTTSSVTVQLPLAPADGQEVRIIDVGNATLGNASVNNITIDFNGGTYYGGAGPLTISFDSGSSHLLHVGSRMWINV